MVNQNDESLTKVTLNLFTSDVEYIKQCTGWTGLIRNILRNEVDRMKKADRLVKGEPV